jgi:2-phospho-L-lactate guanylyltransferase
MSALWIIVPVKDSRFSKQRLAERLSADHRQALAHAMLEDVLEAILAVRSRAPCVLVTVDPFAKALAVRHGMRTIADGAHDGHTGAVDAARRRLAEEGATGFLTMPGDIPLVTSAEINDLLDAHNHRHGFTIAPSHDEQGSNGIACSPPLAVTLRFGEDSFYPHLDAARLAGLEPAVRRLSGFAADVDVPEDIERLMEWDRDGTSRAVRYLRSIGFADTVGETEQTR